MLRTLVNKFKSHTLTEEENSMGPPVRKSARLNAPEEETEGEHERDSGTESDDEELQRLDHTELSATSGNSNRNSNQQPHSATSDETTTSYCRRTHSPPLISELDTNSWDSMGNESGIVVLRGGDSSEDSDSILTVSELLYDNNSRIDQQTKQNASRRATNVVSGAFRPVGPRRQQRSLPENAHNITNTSDLSNQQQRGMVVGEKRKWSIVNNLSTIDDDNCELNTTTTTDGSGVVVPYTAKLRSSTGIHNNLTPTAIAPRETLTAARRTPVRLLIPPTASSTVAPPPPPPSHHHEQHDTNVSKRVRSKAVDFTGAAARPSLDFEKMLERMMKPNTAAQQHNNNSIMNKSTGGDNSSKTKLRGWACSRRHCVGNTVACAQGDCVFRPVEPAAASTTINTNNIAGVSIKKESSG